MQEVEHTGRGQKRSAEGSPNNSHHMVAADGDVQMDRVSTSFVAYEEYGGLRMVACREPEEEMRDFDEQAQGEDEGDWSSGEDIRDDHWNPLKFELQEKRS